MLVGWIIWPTTATLPVRPRPLTWLPSRWSTAQMQILLPTDLTICHHMKRRNEVKKRRKAKEELVLDTAENQMSWGSCAASTQPTDLHYTHNAQCIVSVCLQELNGPWCFHTVVTRLMSSWCWSSHIMSSLTNLNNVTKRRRLKMWKRISAN